MTDKIKKIHPMPALAVLVLLVVITLLILKLDLKNTEFEPFKNSNILSIISSLFVIAIFMERSIEALLTPVRAPDRQTLFSKIQFQNS